MHLRRESVFVPVKAWCAALRFRGREELGLMPRTIYTLSRSRLMSQRVILTPLGHRFQTFGCRNPSHFIRKIEFQYRITLCVKKIGCVARTSIADWGWSCVGVHRAVSAWVHIGVGAHWGWCTQKVVCHLVHIGVAKRGPSIGVRFRRRLVDQPGVH